MYLVLTVLRVIEERLLLLLERLLLGELGGSWPAHCLVDLTIAVEPGLDGLIFGELSGKLLVLRAILKLIDHLKRWCDELVVILRVIIRPRMSDLRTLRLAVGLYGGREPSLDGGAGFLVGGRALEHGGDWEVDLLSSFLLVIRRQFRMLMNKVLYLIPLHLL